MRTPKNTKSLHGVPASAVKGRLHRAFSPISARRLCHADEAETAVHGCLCQGDMAVRMRKALARPWVGVRVCHFLLLSFYCVTAGRKWYISQILSPGPWSVPMKRKRLIKFV